MPFSDKKPAVVPERTVRGAKQRLQAGDRGGEEQPGGWKEAKRGPQVSKDCRHKQESGQQGEGKARGAVRSASKCFIAVRTEAVGAGSSSSIGR